MAGLLFKYSLFALWVRTGFSHYQVRHPTKIDAWGLLSVDSKEKDSINTLWPTLFCPESTAPICALISVNALVVNASSLISVQKDDFFIANNEILINFINHHNNPTTMIIRFGVFYLADDWQPISGWYWPSAAGELAQVRRVCSSGILRQWLN